MFLQTSLVRRCMTLVEQLGLVRGARALSLLAAKRMLDPAAFLSYSQFGEDRVLSALLPDTRCGFYVDIGANHPVSYSNTYMLYQQGWSGILVEPNSELCEQLARVRPRDIVVNAAVDSQDGMVEMFFSRHSNLISGVGPKTEGAWQRSVDDSDVRMVDAKTVSSIINRHGRGRPVDFMNIDVEGHELACLKGIDFGKAQIKLIAVEMHGLDLQVSAGNEIVSFMQAAGYKLVAFSPPTGFFRFGS